MYATIKLLRLLANVSIDEGVGQTLASNPETIQVCHPWSNHIYCRVLVMMLIVYETYRNFTTLS